MAMSVRSADHEEDELSTTINVTPLVDVMLVLLIIFLITVPVVLKAVHVSLPNARNIATQTKPENIVIAVDRDGKVYWNNAPIADNNELIAKMEDAVRRAAASGQTLPEVHIRGDKDARFEAIGRVVYDAQRSAIPKVGFITEPQNVEQ